MKKVHYAWFICAGCAILLFCTFGLALNVFSIYQPYIISLNGFSNTQASTMLAFRNFSSLLAMFFVGKYYEKLGMRKGMTIAGMTVAASFALFGLADCYWKYCLAAVVTGIGFGVGSMIPVTMLIGRWFVQKRDTAIGICAATTGISMLGIPSLISFGIEANGLGKTFLTEALVMGVLILIAGLLLRNSPEEMKTGAYGSEKMPGEGLSSEASQKSQEGRDLTRTELIILIAVLLILGGVANVSCTHLTVLITGEGFSESTAALALSLTGLFLMFGKMSYGRLEDLWGTIKCNNVFAPILLLGIALCCFIGKATFLLFPAVILYSFGVSYMSVGLSTWPAEVSSEKKRNRMIQIFQICYSAGSLIFAPIPGIMADASSGSYVGAYWLFFGLGILVFVSIQTILRRHA